MLTKGRFPHRTNGDGTTDSICPHCFRTIGISTYEADLDAIEASHVCDPALLQHYEEQLRWALKRAVRSEGSPGVESTEKIG
jgi:hypothetical protein